MDQSPQSGWIVSLLWIATSSIWILTLTTMRLLQVREFKQFHLNELGGCVMMFFFQYIKWVVKTGPDADTKYRSTLFY